ncbi:MAG TPA: TlpA disulfide reductase family protein [candidate division Zixibacteria bacterium]
MKIILYKLPLSLLILFLLSCLTQGTEIKSKAFNFSAEDLDGNKIELKTSLDHGPVLISFWATHCKPCIQELNQIQKFYQEYKKKGLEVLAIDVDGPRSISAVKPKVKGLKWEFPVLMDTNKDIYRKYQVLGIPHTVIVDRSGDIRYTHTTYRSGDEKLIQKKLDELLEEQPNENDDKKGEKSGE